MEGMSKENDLRLFPGYQKFRERLRKKSVKSRIPQDGFIHALAYITKLYKGR